MYEKDYIMKMLEAFSGMIARIVGIKEKGELDKAIMAYKKAIALKPNYARAHNNLAVVYFRKANYKLAIFHCDKVVAIRGSGNKTLLEMLKPYRTRNPQ